MRSRFVMAVALAVLAGCRVEGKNDARGAADTSAMLDQPSRPAVAHAVFKRSREAVAPGLVRSTVWAIVRMDAGADSAKKVMEAILAAERQSDSTAAAVRVLSFLPPPRGHQTSQQVMLVPLAFTDWAPEPGFDSLSVATRSHPYRTTTTFVHDAAMLRGMMGRDSGTAPLPCGRMPVPRQP